jgi:hypothetical protein
MRIGPTLSLLASPVLLVMGIGIQQTSALTLEQARENCRESVGRPIVQFA